MTGGQWGPLAGMSGGAGGGARAAGTHTTVAARAAGPPPGRDSRLIQTRILGSRVLTGRRAWRAGAPAGHRGAAGAGYGRQSQCGFRCSAPDLAPPVDTTGQRTQVKRRARPVPSPPGISPDPLGTCPPPARSTPAGLPPLCSGQLHVRPRRRFGGAGGVAHEVGRSSQGGVCGVTAKSLLLPGLGQRVGLRDAAACRRQAGSEVAHRKWGRRRRWVLGTRLEPGRTPQRRKPDFGSVRSAGQSPLCSRRLRMALLPPKTRVLTDTQSGPRAGFMAKNTLDKTLKEAKQLSAHPVLKGLELAAEPRLATWRRAEHSGQSRPDGHV